MNYTILTDDALVNLLFAEEDRLPRAAVDEFLKRGEKMVEPLAKIANKNFYWTGDISHWWAAIHAVFILGAIATEQTVVPLLNALRFSCAYDCDWVTEQLASIFGKVGIKSIEGLKMIAADYSTDWYVRATAMDGLAAITITNPEKEEDIFAFVGGIFCHETEDKDTQLSAGNVLLDFHRKEVEKELLDFGRKERALKDKDSFYHLYFDDEDVREAFNGRGKDLWYYQQDWLDFYNENEIAARQKRWKEEQKAANNDNEFVEEAEDFLRINPDSFIRNILKIGRNEPCPCGSGKKYKKCCGTKIN